jgi:hypothetical protein
VWLTDAKAAVREDNPGEMVRLTIEIDPSSQPIAGWLQPNGEPKRDFVGILELISLLEWLRERPPTGAP